MSKLSYAEKKSWVVARKEDGNKLYRSGKHEEAIEKYMEAVMGVAIGDSPSDRKDAILTLQVPLLSNLAACMMVKGQYGRGRSLLDEAVSVLEHTGKGKERKPRRSLEFRCICNTSKYTRVEASALYTGYLNKAIGDLKRLEAHRFVPSIDRGRLWRIGGCECKQ